MPRQIIDTESSRPAYVRRLAITWSIVIVVVALLAFGAWTFVGAHHAPPSAFPGNSAR